MTDEHGLGSEHDRIHTERRLALELLNSSSDVMVWISRRRTAINTLSAGLPASRGKQAVHPAPILRATFAGADQFLRSTLGDMPAILRFSIIPYGYTAYDRLYVAYGSNFDNLSGRLVVLYGRQEFCEPVYWRVPDQPNDRSPRIDEASSWGLDLSDPPLHTD